MDWEFGIGMGGDRIWWVTLKKAKIEERRGLRGRRSFFFNTQSNI